MPETAGNEKEHAEIWFKLLHDGMPDTMAENLKDAAAGENYEWTDMYASLPRKPRRRALIKLPSCLRRWAKIEKEHEERYHALAANVRKRQGLLRRASRSAGSASTAATSITATKLPKCARFVRILRHISRCVLRIIDIAIFCWKKRPKGRFFLCAGINVFTTLRDKKERVVRNAAVI